MSSLSVDFIVGEGFLPEDITAIKEGGGMIAGEPRIFDPYEYASKYSDLDILEDYSDTQFEPLMVITVSLAIGFLIKRISDIWLDHRRAGGQIIDTRGGTISIRVAPYLDRGDLVLQSDEGVQVFMLDDHDEALPIIEKVILGHAS